MLIFWMTVLAPAFAGKDFTETVRVKIPKPEIQILITRRNLTPKYDLELKESFLPQIVDATRKKPF